ncbi:MAG: hypothetical protein K0R03_2408 [Moraxellaceae bacterium]|jgi:hypothetical protein|nr:hypothetical protein [Moraxellaceae bacterium]
MNKFTLNFQNLSHAMLSRLVDLHGHLLPGFVPQLVSHYAELETHRARMSYNTGSISLSAGVFLFMVCNTFKPKVVVEVGTFLGKSTTAMALGMSWNDSTERHIYTCDKDNPCLLAASIGPVRIHPHSGQTSTEMFRHLVSQGVKADILSLDGRLTAEDLPLLSDLCHSETVVLLDDFEGIEKGVVNYQALMSLLPNYLFMPPVMSSRLQAFGVVDPHCTAMLMPTSLLAITRQ